MNFPSRPSVYTALLVTGTAILCGCTSPAYLVQAVRGHHQVMAARTPCAELIEDPRTSTELKSRLLLADQMCHFAARELGLEPDGHYQHYADLKRPFVVWNVYAAREFSVEPRTWRYPFVGSLEYRGYFQEADARRYASRLAGQGWETHLAGATAYSTLGWFHDPLLNTFLWTDETQLAETIFHELAHQRVFAGGDTDFNEAFATLVGREGTRRWMQSRGDTNALQSWEEAVVREEQWVALALQARAELEQLYTSREQGTENPVADGEIRERKRAILERLHQQQASLLGLPGERCEPGRPEAGDWNNARLNAVATYYELVPAFYALFTSCGHDLPAFYRAVEALADMDSERRLEALHNASRGELAGE